MLGDCSEGFFVIRLIFKAAFVRRPGPYKSDKAPGDGNKKSYQDKRDSAFAYHKNTFQVKKRIPKKLEQGKPPAIQNPDFDKGEVYRILYNLTVNKVIWAVVSLAYYSGGNMKG